MVTCYGSISFLFCVCVCFHNVGKKAHTIYSISFKDVGQLRAKKKRKNQEGQKRKQRAKGRQRRLLYVLAHVGWPTLKHFLISWLHCGTKPVTLLQRIVHTIKNYCWLFMTKSIIHINLFLYYDVLISYCTERLYLAASWTYLMVSDIISHLSSRHREGFLTDEI